MEERMELDVNKNADAAESNTANKTDTAENDGCNKQVEKLFTQSELEALISERMKRERKNARSLNSVKELLNTLKSGGVIKEGSYSDMAAQLVGMFSVNEEKNADAGKNDVHECGEDTKQYESYTSTEEASLVVGQQPEETQNAPLVDTVGQFEEGIVDDGKSNLNANALFEFKKLYPDADLNTVFQDQAFLSFAKGRRGQLHEIYGDYSDFVDKLRHDSEANSRRMYSAQGSTAFSSDLAYTTDYAQRLTRRQMDIANSCGMSYREYTELLSSIPNAPKRSLN